MKKIISLISVLFFAQICFAAVDGSISGTVLDQTGVAMPKAMVQLLGANGAALLSVQTSETGEYRFFPVQFGDYQVSVSVTGFLASITNVHVSSGAESQVPVVLQTQECWMKYRLPKHDPRGQFFLLR